MLEEEFYAKTAALAPALSEKLDALLLKHPLTVLNPQQINPELRATLEALGYLAPAPETAPPIQDSATEPAP